MNRNKKMLLNKANGALKIISNYYNHVTLTIEYYTLTINILGVELLEWKMGEELIKYFIDKNISWNLHIKDKNLIIKIIL